MCKRFVVLKALFLLCIQLLITDASALGAGPSCYCAGGKGLFGVDSDNTNHGGMVTLASKHADSRYESFPDATAARSIVSNYRFKIGRERARIKLDDTYRVKATTEPLNWSMRPDLGITLIQNKDIRFWLGPEFKKGIGPVFGVNFHFGPVKTFTFRAGFLWAGMGGLGNHCPVKPGNMLSYAQDDSGTDSRFFINFSILFRPKDNDG